MLSNATCISWGWRFPCSTSCGVWHQVRIFVLACPLLLNSQQQPHCEVKKGITFLKTSGATMQLSPFLFTKTEVLILLLHITDLTAAAVICKIYSFLEHYEGCFFDLLYSISYRAYVLISLLKCD